MQHKLFYSKLRPSVGDLSLLEIIRSSSSGENPHRAAAMEMTFERLIQEHRERVIASMKESESQPPPVKATATDKGPAITKPTVTNERPSVGPTVASEQPTTSKPKPARSAQKQPPPPKPATGVERYSLPDFFEEHYGTLLPAQTTTSPPKERRK